MKSSVTICLVPEALGGPFVYRDSLPTSVARAAALGFDAVEVFPPGAEPEDVDRPLLRRLLTDHGMALAAVGTGAGWVRHKLTLTHEDAGVREEARDFVRRIIDLAGPFHAPAIVGSMQGRHGDGVEKDRALGYLGEALAELGEHAKAYGVPLLFEPLNRYESNLSNTVEDALKLLTASGAENVALLADLFHMNIEEVHIADGLLSGGPRIGHVHFVDSNRRAAGMGHIDFGPIISALRSIRYKGYLSAEALPLPDPEAAARRTIAAFHSLTTG
ncbi:sugar phosphate isomerase/epimerase family protein [Isosphaeraceae bacterium EP7]